MANSTKFDAETILTDTSLTNVYHSLCSLAQEFAILGHIKTASILVSLLLSEYSSDWQRRQVHFLKFAFAETGHWPKEIPAEERTEEALNQITPHDFTDPQVASLSHSDATAKLEQTLKYGWTEYSDATTGGAAMVRSSALTEALAIAIRLASERATSIEEIERNAAVQEVLGHISTRLHANSLIQYLAQLRGVWPLLASGALARSAQVDPAKVEKLATEVINTFSERLKHGRKTHSIEAKSIKELLSILDCNSKENSKIHWEEVGDEAPESFFILPPASDEQITSLERKIGVKLPRDYKEFLKISNGFGGTWNGYYPDPPLDGVEQVDWADMYMQGLPIELHDCPTGNFFSDLPVEENWPGYTKALNIGQEDIFNVWFIPPEETENVVEAYKNAMQNPKLEDKYKLQTQKTIVSFYGSWEAFESLEWVVIDMDKGFAVPRGSFTQFLQEKTKASFKNRLEEGADENRACFSYSCKYDHI